MEKEWCILYKKKTGRFFSKTRVEPYVCWAHQYSSAVKEFNKIHNTDDIVAVYQEYRKR